MRARDRFADCVLDRSNDSFHYSDPGMVLRERDSKLYGGELEIEGGDYVHLSIYQILACFNVV